MNLLDFINSLTHDEREKFATRCNTSVNYLRQVAYGNRTCGESLAISIDRESFGMVSMDELRPDVDWSYVRRRNRRSKKASEATALE